MAFPSASKSIRSALIRSNHVAIPSATMALTSAISKNMWPFHLPMGGNNISHQIHGYSICHSGNNISQHRCGYSICHTIILLMNNHGNTICYNSNNISHPYKVTVTSATEKYQLLHKMVISFPQ